MLRNLRNRYVALPALAKGLLIIAALITIGTSLALSPLMAILALLVLIVAVIVLITRILRRRPLTNWDLIAVVALLFVLVYGGISGALLSGGSQQASSPSESSLSASALFSRPDTR